MKNFTIRLGKYRYNSGHEVADFTRLDPLTLAGLLLISLIVNDPIKTMRN